MLFNSFAFLFFFAPAFYLVYWKVSSDRGKKAVSVLASYLFYGVWDWRFALLMLATTSVDYFTALRIDRTDDERARKRWLVASMISNLGVLALFKYYDFFADSFALLTHVNVPLLHVVLPIGISFYTFESMSYTIDVYKRDVPAAKTFLDYAHFVTMFPRLVAGPIARYKDVVAQLPVTRERLNAEVVSEVIQFFAIGMAKKILIADVIAGRLVNPLFLQSAHLNAVEAWLAALGYTAQLYFDFSGYSDMAVGLALFMGIRLPRNFELPYASANPSEFWRRWHISLSTWLRDYLFIPLGGSRASKWKVARNLMITMGIGGLWHGANWTFVVWGLLHGSALVLYNLKVLRAKWMPRGLAIALTFAFTVVAWVIFRAPTLGEAGQVLVAMIGAHGIGLTALRAYAPIVAFLAFAFGIAFTRDTYDLIKAPSAKRGLVLAVVAAACLAKMSEPSPFLYFQF